jgi:predicted HTH domain antitoxin
VSYLAGAVLVISLPDNLPDLLQETPEEFEREARMAMAAKLFERKRLSSGIAAQLAGMGRAEFLLELHCHGVPMIDIRDEELAFDAENA